MGPSSSSSSANARISHRPPAALVLFVPGRASARVSLSLLLRDIPRLRARERTSLGAPAGGHSSPG